MSARYVRVPFGSRIQYPRVCPFTGNKNPKGVVRIKRRETQIFLPIPFIGWFRLGKTGQTAFPAARRIAIVAKILRVLPLIFFFGGFISLKWTMNGPYAFHILFGGIAMMYLCHFLEWLWLRRVRIVRIEMNSLEVRFASQEYAEEFCHLNELHCHTNPGAKRSTPITVNDIR